MPPSAAATGGYMKDDLVWTFHEENNTYTFTEYGFDKLEIFKRNGEWWLRFDEHAIVGSFDHLESAKEVARLLKYG